MSDRDDDPSARSTIPKVLNLLGRRTFSMPDLLPLRSAMGIQDLKSSQRAKEGEALSPIELSVKANRETQRQLVEEIVQDDNKFRAFQKEIRRNRLMTNECLQICVTGIMKDSLRGPKTVAKDDEKERKQRYRPKTEDSFIWKKLDKANGPFEAEQNSSGEKQDGGDVKLLHNMLQRGRHSCHNAMDQGAKSAKPRRRSSYCAIMPTEEASLVTEAVSAAVQQAISAVSNWASLSGVAIEGPAKRQPNENMIPVTKKPERTTTTLLRKHPSYKTIFRRHSIATASPPEAISIIVEWDKNNNNDNSNDNDNNNHEEKE